MRKQIVFIFLFSCAFTYVQAQINIINTIAGTDSAGYCCDGGPATNAALNVPEGLCLDNFGNLYIADGFNNCIRRLKLSTGIITTIAGNNSLGFSGDGGPATNAELYVPETVFADSAGNVYIADAGNNRIRKVSISTGVITTIAGSGAAGVGAGGESGDGGPATNAELNVPVGLCLDVHGNIYIGDYSNNKIRKVDATTGIIKTIAGTETSGYTGGFVGYSGDGGPATDAKFSGVANVFVDHLDNLYICDQWNHAIRKVNPATGIISTIAGKGIAGYSGDNGLAINAQLNQPCGIYVDIQENIFIAEYGDGVIRRIDGYTGIITTIAGTGTRGFSGDGGPATNAELQCGDVFLDSHGVVYIADEDNNRIRAVYNPKLAVPSIQSTLQNYNISPNPSDGNITLSQLVKDTAPVFAQIWNTSGVSIYKEQLLFTNGVDQLHVVNAVPGLYLLQLTDSKGRVFILKFVIQ